ncbi:bifunctional 2-C-methyl-D-erythritol 4-phosphate cytidylyltransferase/2-C-methyl-D-erythritol 2,4-cyclodiphosphate synthase [soil metagenome]
MPSPSLAVIVVAAGSGTRLGHELPKALVELGGIPMLARALRAVHGSSEPAQVIVVAGADWADDARALSGDATVVTGGATRQASVAAGLAVLAPEVEVVLVHDAARALAPAALFDTVAAAVRASGGGVVPGLPVADTIKRIEAGAVIETVDRGQLSAVQTPQGFPRDALVAAYEQAAEDHTDDAALFAAAGHPVAVVEGDRLAFKITTAWDLRRAESLLDPAAAFRPQRTGVGVDVHAYDAGSPLWLGGLHWPDEIGLAGHSDGDAVCHAICDALLSAAGLGDMGSRFGTGDPRHADASGELFLRETLAATEGAGWSVGNVAVQVIGELPKIGPRRAEIEARLSELVGAPVSVSATTTDGLGFTGRAEGIAAIATALLIR